MEKSRSPALAPITGAGVPPEYYSRAVPRPAISCRGVPLHHYPCRRVNHMSRRKPEPENRPSFIFMCPSPCSGRSAAGIVLQPAFSGRDTGIKQPIGGENHCFPKQWCHFFRKQCQTYRKNRETEAEMTSVGHTSYRRSPALALLHPEGSAVPQQRPTPKPPTPGFFPPHTNIHTTP
jgi:hypothetical protein